MIRGIIFPLNEAGERTAGVCRRHGISEGTFCKCKSEHGGMEPSDAERLQALEDGTARLKKLLAGQMLDNGMVGGVTSNVVTPDAKRHAVTHLCEVHGVSERRAYHVLRADRSTVRNMSRRGDDADLRAAIKHIPRELVRIMSDRGLPGTIVSGNGAEFTGTAILRRVRNAGID